MKKFLAVLIFIALSFSDTIDPSQIKSMNVSFVIKATISVNHGNILLAFANVTVPQATEYQTTNYTGFSQVDGNGNKFGVIRIPNPSNPFNLNIATSVVTTGRITTDIPSSYSVPMDIVKYTMVTNRVQSNDPEIKNLSINLTANATDNFERVAILSEYVHDLVTYDLSYVGTWKDAVWILENKRGVCLEYATLFAAMTRSLGIPTRILLGYAYDPSQRAMIGHAWDEVYLGKWVPVDPLWQEIGYLDGGHVETARIIDNETPDQLGVIPSGEGSVEVSFRTSTSDPTYQSKTVPKNVSYFERMGNYTLNDSLDIVSGGSAVVQLSLNATQYRVDFVNMSPSAECGDSLALQDTYKMLILETGKTAKANWMVSAKDDLDREYRCQLTLTSPYLEERSIAVTVHPAKSVNTANNTASTSSTLSSVIKSSSCLPILILTTLLGVAMFCRRR